jgi:terminase, large subunit
MSFSAAQIKSYAAAVTTGLSTLYKQPPMTPVEWADMNFYLSSESSYQEGRWETLPFQVAMLNAMGNDEIRTVNYLKSARVGFSKMQLAATAYQLQHKRRNVLVFVPTDSSANNFMKSQIETMIRDVPELRDLAPWYGSKHRDNTLELKRFSNSKLLYCRGGKAAKNYRELSVDTVIYDELAAFDRDVEQEGTPVFLGDKRIEGSAFPKSIRGSTPKTNFNEEMRCQITAASESADVALRLHLPCPHCGGEQYLKWGGLDCAYGIKWDAGKPDAPWYLCEHNGCVIQQHEMQEAQPLGRWICERTGIWTKDAFDFFDTDGQPVPTPESVSFHIWTAYSPMTTWGRIVLDFLTVKNDRNKLKTFTNTTLGEAWEEDQGEKLEWETLYGRREVYPQVPDRALVLVGGIDTQDDRYEGRVWAFGAGEESWLVDKWILTGDPAGEDLRKKVREKLRLQYRKADGQVMPVLRWAWDSGGHYTDEVYSESKKAGIQWVVPVKGASLAGQPIAAFPRRRHKSGTYLTLVGTDNAKELIYNRLRIDIDPARPVPGFMHLPADELLCDADELKQLTAERKVMKIEKGQRVYRWESGGRRNEALDCAVYALAALRISQQRFGLNLDQLEVARTAAQPPEPQAALAAATEPQQPRQPAGWLNTGGDPWL